MAYKLFEIDKADKSVVYVSAKELREKTGVSRSTLHNHIVTNKVDAFRFRNRTYFLPEDAQKYYRLFNCKLLGGG